MAHLAAQDATTRDATVRLAAHGDEAAFERLVAAHNPAMARVAFVICGDVETTRDAVQAAWSLAWRRLHTLRDEDAIHAWLVSIAANEARQAVRRQRRHPVVDISEALGRQGNGDPAESVALVDLQRGLARLRPDDRRLIALRFVAGLDSTEIAHHTGGTASAVRSRLSRLLERLRLDIDHA
jgi:RNA polymerase sigma factor (sigma-70 family)